MEDRQDCWGTYEMSLSELRELPTITEGQIRSLKMESDSERVWLSRGTVEDGEPWNNLVSVERLFGGSWIEVEQWEAVNVSHERITAADVQVGDRIARAKTHAFCEVRAVDPTGVSVWITLERVGRIRPRATAKLWREAREG